MSLTDNDVALAEAERGRLRQEAVDRCERASSVTTLRFALMRIDSLPVEELQRKAVVRLDEIKRTILSCLLHHGWSGVAVGTTALATKVFMTAVGEKQAFAYLSEWAPNDANYSLAGDYVSEGRNILEARGMLIRKDAGAQMVTERGMLFARQVDMAVVESYAARLLPSEVRDAALRQRIADFNAYSDGTHPQCEYLDEAERNSIVACLHEQLGHEAPRARAEIPMG